MALIKKDVADAQISLVDSVPGDFDQSFSDGESWEDEDQYESSGQVDYFEALADMLEQIRSSEGFLAPMVRELAKVAVDRVIDQMIPDDVIDGCLVQAFSEQALLFAFSVHVSSADLNCATKVMSRVNASIIVKVDPLLSRGELVVETPRGRVHVGAREQVAAMFDSFDMERSDDNEW